MDRDFTVQVPEPQPSTLNESTGGSRAAQNPSNAANQTQVNITASTSHTPQGGSGVVQTQTPAGEGTVTRWFFKPVIDHPHDFFCVKKSSPPVKAGIAQRFAKMTLWDDDKGLKVGPNTITIGISLGNMNVNCLESVTFSVGSGTPSYDSPEVISPQVIKDLSATSGSDVVMIELDRRLEVTIDNVQSLQINMEIVLATNKQPATNGDYVELHYLDLRAYDPHGSIKGPFSLPHLWSIKVDHEKGSDVTNTSQPAELSCFAISGNGNFVATLSVKGNYLQLDLWDLQLNDKSVVSQAGITGAEMDGDNYSEHRSPCAQSLIPLSLVNDHSFIPVLGMVDDSFTISVSWDGSMVALMIHTKQHINGTFQALKIDRNPEKTPASGLPVLTSLGPIAFNKLCPKLEAFCGFGKFHIKDQNRNNELFITCDGVSVDIYSVIGAWNHVRGIKLSVNSPIPNPKSLIDGLRGHYFGWLNEDDIVLICDLNSRIVSYSEEPYCSRVIFSSDGSKMVFQAGNTFTTRWTRSGTELSSATIPHNIIGGVDFAFLENDDRIIIPTGISNEHNGRGIPGVILDATNFSTVGMAYVPIARLQHLQSGGTHSQYLYTSSRSTLRLTSLKDVMDPPKLPSSYQCDRRCFTELSATEVLDDMLGESLDGPLSLTSGLTFSVKYLRVPSRRSQEPGLRSVSVWLSDGQGEPREVLLIPPIDTINIPKSDQQYDVAFDLPNLQMIVFTGTYVMVWRVPTTLDENFMLLLAWSTPISPIQTPGGDYSLLNEVAHCSHGHQYIRVLQNRNLVDTLRLHSDDAFGPYPSQFLNGIPVLVEMFSTGDSDFRQLVLSYIGRYLNRYSPGDDASIMFKICQNITQKNWMSTRTFLKALLDSEHGRWVPRPGLESNPIGQLLDRGDPKPSVGVSVPRAIDIAQIVIDYCIRMAKKEKDHQFISPVMGCLGKLVSLRRQRSDVVSEILQKLAFIPARKQSFVIDRAIIPRSAGLSPRPIYDCRNPVLHLDRTSLSTEHVPQNDNFTRDLFVASFEMLWHVSVEQSDPPSRIPPRLPKLILECIKQTQAKISMHRRSLEYIVLYIAMGLPDNMTVGMFFSAMRLFYGATSTVKYHDFALESLDNPAIAALIEYKWNTFGFIYWFSRFLLQCIYYILVLVAVFVQVYSEQQEQLLGVFIAITVMACYFLILESVYNWMDIIVFSLPSAGSVCQILNITIEGADYNTSTLSFSVLFIFLHFLFELRVNKMVCHFVTIITGIIGGIRLFFIVFAAGILAFTIAILHLIRACPSGTCDQSGVKFPRHFFGAISSTYFFMGGIWDPVSDELSGDDWSIHIMMIFYFFFTTILLLNVLISFINNAFNVADETWQLVWVENRMQYVVAAERIFCAFPEYRKQRQDYFPEEIYYSATFHEVKAYTDKYPSSDMADQPTQPEEKSKPSKEVSVAKTTVPVTCNNAVAGQRTENWQNPTQQSYLRSEQQQQLIEQRNTIRELKNETQQSRQQLNELKEQLTRQQQSFDEQTKESQRQMTLLQDTLHQQFAALRDALSAAPGVRPRSAPEPTPFAGAPNQSWSNIGTTHHNSGEQDEDDTEFSIL
ncbi:hypothetical protein BGX31_006717 [Mortierella sp. GBA43]|nr:hypothetical protein BGX31_006717 [Mortierella sp. GBA43]